MQQFITKTAIGTAAFAALALGGSAIASAASGTSTTTTGSTSTATSTSGAAADTDAAADAAGGRHDHGGPGGQRADEQPVTGARKDKLVAAAKAKYSGATIERVESDADGDGVYEAHVTKSDGSRATVFFDKSGSVTKAVDGMGSGPARDAAPAPATA